MNVAPLALGIRLADMNRWLTQVSPTAAGLTFGGGAILMLLGLYLRWRLPEYRMLAEERTKEGRLTEEQARFRIQILRFSGPAAVLIGIVLFTVLFWT